MGVAGVTGEVSNGEVRSSDGDDVVLVLVLVVVVEGAASGIVQPGAAATSPSTTRLNALPGLCGPNRHPNQLLRRADLGMGATTVGSDASVIGRELSAIASDYSDSKQSKVHSKEQTESKTASRIEIGQE